MDLVFGIRFLEVAGVLVVALPVPVIVSNFAMYYSHTQVLPNNRYLVSSIWYLIVTIWYLVFGIWSCIWYLGMFVRAMCAMAGVLVVALPVPVIVSNFAMYYSHTQVFGIWYLVISIWCLKLSIWYLGFGIWY